MKLHLESTRASAFRKILTAFLAVQTIALNFSPAWAAPAADALPSTADTRASIDGNKMTVVPGGGRQTIEWDSFHIGSDAWVYFQDAAGDVTVNKITGGGQSEIFGQLDASGIIYLLNRSGVLFGEGSHVNVGGLVASTFMDVIEDADGKLVFQNDPGTGDITVEGGATINAGAFAYLVGQNVNLAGSVNAGDVIVAAFGNQTDDYEDDGGKILVKLGGNTNSASGDITLTTNFTVSASVVTNADTLEVTTVDPNTITLFAVQKISQADGIWQAGAPVSLTAGSGDITLANENEFAGTVSASAANGALTLTSKNAIELGNVTAANLTVASKEGDSHGNGIGQAEGTAVVVTGMATLTTVNGGVILTNAMNDFGTVSVEALPHSLVQLTDKNSIELGKVDAAALTVTATDGSISQVAETAVNVKYGTELQASGAITLANTGNDFGWESGAVTAKAGGDVTLTDKNAIKLGTVTASNLTVTARNGDITQTSDKTVTATGTTALNASGDILLTDFENDFATVSARAGGDMSLYDANDLTVEDATAGGAVYVNTFDDLTVGNVEAKGIVLRANTNLTVTGTVHGNTTNSAVLVSADKGLLTVEEGAVVLNDTGWVTMSGRTGIVFDGQAEGSSVTFDASSGTDGALTSGENAHVTAREDVTVWTKGNMDLPAIDAGRLGGEVLGTGDITQSGAIHTTATNRSVDLTTYRGSITLNNADNSFSGNTRFVTGGDLDVHATGDLTVALASAKNDMTLTADGGLTADYLTAGGAATLTAGNDIALNREVSVTNALTATAGGSIIQGTNGVITVGDTATLTATAGSITLTNAANDFGGAVTATATGGDVKLADKNDLELGAVTAGGGVDARAGGNLDVTGAVKGDQRVYLEAVNGTARVDAPVESTSQDVRIVARDVESTTNGTITAATDVGIGMGSTTNVTLSGKVTAGNDVLVNGWVNTLDADIEAGLDLNVVGTGAGDITVTTNANLKAGNFLGLTAGYDIGSGPQDGSIIVDGNAEAGDQLQFIAYGTGDVVQASTSTLKSDRVTVLEAHHGNITAESESNEFGPEGVATVAPEGTVSVAATNGIVFRTVDTTQLTAKAVSGDITQRSDKPFAVTGATTLEAPGNIVLTNADNEFGGVVTATAGAAVSLTDANAIELGAVTATDLTVDAKGGTITQASGTAVTATGATTLTATDAITLANADNDFGGTVTATATNGSVKLADANALTLADVKAKEDIEAKAGTTLAVGGIVSAGRDLTLESGDDMTVTKALSAGRNLSLTSTNGDLTVTSTGSATAGTNAVLTSAGNMELAGAVSGGGEAKAKAGGTFTSTETGTITANNGLAQIDAVTGATVGGDVKSLIADPETAAENAGLVDLTVSAGALTVEDTAEVYAGDTATFTATGGDLTLGGPVAAGHDVNATTDENFENTAEIAALDGDVTIEAGQAATISEAVTATNGKIDITAGNGATVAARMETSRAEDAPEESPAGLVIVMATGGDVKVTTAGSIEAAMDAELAANDGSVEIEGNVTAANDVRGAAREDFKVASGATVKAQGGDAMIGAGSIDIAGTLQSEAQNVGAGATNGNLNVTGQVLAGASIEMGAAVDATISGTVEGVEMVGVDALGKATVKDGGKVSSTGADGIAAVVGDEAEVEHGGTVIAVAGQAGVAAVNGTATIAGTVTAATNAVVQATGGKAIITSDGTVVATADGGIAGVESTDNAAEIYGMVKALGADGAAGVTGASATVASGATVTAAQGTAGVAATDGAAIIDGTVTGRDAMVISENGTATVSSTGLVDGSQDAVLKGKGDVKVESSGLVQAGRNAAVVSEEGDVLAEAGSTVTAGNDLVMLAETGMLTLGDGAVVTAAEDMVLKANRNVDLSTADVHGYNVGIESTTGDIADTKATLVADHTMVLVAGDDVTLMGGPKAENLGIQSKGDITFEDLKVKKFAATSTDGNVTVSMVQDTELAQLKVDGSDITGKVTAERADLAGEEDSTITVSGVTGSTGALNGIQAKKGDVTVENPDHAVTGTQIVASRGSVDVMAATVGLDSTYSGGRTVINAGEVTRGSYTAGGNLDLTISGNLTAGSLAGANVNLLGVGGNLTAGSVTAGSAVDGTVNGSATVQTLDAGGPVELEIGSAATFGDARSGGDFTITTGGELKADNLNVGGNLDANVGGGATLTKASISGDEKLKVSGTLSFDTMSTHGAQIEAGSIHMGKLTAGNATIQSHGTITDNSSLVNVSTLTMTAGGDIGSAGNPINTEVGSRIDRISGRNIYLVEQSSGHNIVLGVIDASGHLSLSAPRIGLPDGVYGFMNGNGEDVNIRAGAGLEMNLGGRFGTADNPMRADVTGEWTILNGELQGTPMSYIYVVMANSDYTDTPEYTGTVAIPGLVIVNGRPILGHPDLLRKIYSALAFSVDTPELKSKQGIFGSPLFLHSDLGLFNGGEETGVDYWNLIQNDLLEPNNGKNANVYGPRRWGLDDSLWDSERMSRSRLYLLEFDPLPAAKEKTAAKATEAKAAPAKPEAAKAEAKPAPAPAEAKPAAAKPAAKSAAKPAAKAAPSKPAGGQAK